MNDFYQSPADKMRLDVLLNSLLEGRLNLAILGHDEIALAHYARTIHEHLRQHGQQVELWSSAESDQLVDRFNRILADLTLKQAQDIGLASKDNWKKWPDAMLRARCSSALARGRPAGAHPGPVDRPHFGPSRLDPPHAWGPGRYGRAGRHFPKRERRAGHVGPLPPAGV